MQFNLVLYDIAKWPLIPAGALIAIQAPIAILKIFGIDLKDLGSAFAPLELESGGVGDLLKALPALIDSLAKAPAAIVLIFLGRLPARLPTVDAPRVCEAAMAPGVQGSLVPPPQVE